MALNLSALKDLQTDLNSRGGNSLFLNQSDIGEETDVRILPSSAKLNGMYFVEQVVYWINKKPYVSPATLGKDCPIAEELEEAKTAAKKDAGLKKLLDKIEKKSRFLIPVLLLKTEWDKGEPVKVEVVDKKPKILQVGPQLMKAINRIVTHRNFQNGTEEGIADREQGFNIALSKIGKSLETEYSAEAWREPLEMPEKYYGKDKDNNDMIPDVLDVTEKSIKNDDYLRGVVRNFLYGEAMPKDDDDDTDVNTKSGKSSKRHVDDEEEITTKRSASSKAGRHKGKPAVEEEEDEVNKLPFDDEKDTKAGKGKGTKADERVKGEKDAPKAGSKKGRTIVDDLD